jgi:hypothetical protein
VDRRSVRCDQLVGQLAVVVNEDDGQNTLYVDESKKCNLMHIYTIAYSYLYNAGSEISSWESIVIGSSDNYLAFPLIRHIFLCAW